MVYGRYGGRRAYTQSARPIVTIDDAGSPGPDVTRLVRSAAQPLSSLMVVEVHAAATDHWAEVRLPAANRAAAAYTVAVHIAWERCCGAPQYFDAWAVRQEGGSPHKADFLECIEGFLGSECVGTRDAPAPDEHIEGFVAEHIWHLLTHGERARPSGFRFALTAPTGRRRTAGGDGLAIYRVERIASSFGCGSRKRTRRDGTGARGGERGVQAGRRAMRCATLPGSRRWARPVSAMPELQQFYGSLLELWQRRRARGGWRRSRWQPHLADATRDCFGNYPSYWAFGHDDQRQGLVVTIGDYAAFAKQVRQELWNGL